METVTGQAVTIHDMKNGNIIGVIPAGNIIDSAGNNYSEDCCYKLKMVKNDSKKNVLVYEVALKVDAKYFEENNLTYPVKIDPSLEWTSKKTFRILLFKVEQKQILILANRLLYKVDNQKQAKRLEHI